MADGSHLSHGPPASTAGRDGLLFPYGPGAYLDDRAGEFESTRFDGHNDDRYGRDEEPFEERAHLDEWDDE
jgi:hypothetical protein